MNAPNVPITREPMQTQYLLTTTNSTNINLVNSSAKRLYGGMLSNPTGADMYVKLYDKSTAPNPLTDVPFANIKLASGAFVSLYSGELGRYLANGLGIVVTAAFADTDTTPATAGAKIDLAYF